MLLGVDVDFVETPLPAELQLTRVRGLPRTPAGGVTGNGPRFIFDYTGADTAIAINRLLKDGARLWFSAPSRVDRRAESPRDALEPRRRGVRADVVSDRRRRPSAARRRRTRSLRTPRIGLYSPWTGGNIDEGWTRWVLEQYEFTYTTHPQRRHPRTAGCGSSSTPSSCRIRAPREI